MEDVRLLDNQLNKLKTYFGFSRKNIVSDIVAAVTVAIEAIPDSMAHRLLAGINPLTGLYTMIVATPVGALFSSSMMMNISTTSAICLAVGSSLMVFPRVRS